MRQLRHMMFHAEFERASACAASAATTRARRRRSAWPGPSTRGELHPHRVAERLADPLRFRDSKRYPDRLKDAREKTSLDDAILVAHGKIGGHKAVVAVMAFEFIGGSMGAAVGEGIVAAASWRRWQDICAAIVFIASGGARMQEGAVSLMQMPRTVIATRIVQEAGLPFITVLTDPTTGGVTASFTRRWATSRSPSPVPRSASPARG